MKPQSVRTSPVLRFSIVRGWPKLLFALGWVLFWLAGTAGENLPLEALLVGPGIMLTSIVFMMRNGKIPPVMRKKS